MLSEIIDGPVAPLDRVHAFDVLRGICRHAPRPVCSARARLTSVPLGGATPLAIAEAVLVLDGGLVVSAGSEATTMRDAVDDVAAPVSGAASPTSRAAHRSRSHRPRGAASGGGQPVGVKSRVCHRSVLARSHRSRGRPPPRRP